MDKARSLIAESPREGGGGGGRNSRIWPKWG